MEIGISLAEVRCVCIKNDHQAALILHISYIATNNHKFFEKSSERRFLSGWKTFPATLNSPTGVYKAGTLNGTAPS